MNQTAGSEGHRATEAARAVTREESIGSLALWFAVLGSPAAWAGHLAINYALEEWFACSPSATEPGTILGVSVQAVSLAVNTGMLALAVLAGAAALTCLRHVKDGDAPGADRARWMAFAGAVEGGLFTAIILLGYAPPLLLAACQTTP